VFVGPERVYRAVRRDHVAGFEQFLREPWSVHLQRGGRLIPAAPIECPEQLLDLEPDYVFYEHERVPFASYPFEWPAEMLWSAASLTLDLAVGACDHGYGLKDASPYNVLFRGPQPVFVDSLSFEPRDPLVSTWLPYAQFVRTMLLPLVAHKHLGIPVDQMLLCRRDGLEPEEVLRWLSFGRKLRPPFLQLVTMPAWLGSRKSGDTALYQPKRESSPDKARFILRSLLRSLRGTLDSAAPPPMPESRWTGYMRNHSYDSDQFHAKEKFVGDALRFLPAGRLLDVGCNTGHFSELAARAGWSVVAVDLDPAVAGQVWRRASAGNLDVLPLAVNVARPTPPTGWFGQETASFLDRAAGHFDAVLMLALVHHLLVTDRIPLPEIVRLAATLTRDLAVIEYVDPDDPMFRLIARGRDHLHAGLTAAAFEEAFAGQFQIEDRLHQNGSQRRLYRMRKRHKG
jgi:SAM-dependent methyltransferase